jgi:hypothetical protein
MFQNLFSHFLLQPHGRSQDVFQPTSFQLPYRLLADHSPVSYPAYSLQPEFPLNPIHYWQQCLAIRMVPGPHLTTNRSTFLVKYRTHNRLEQIRTVILGISPLSQALAPLFFKVDTRGVKEGQCELAEQVSPFRKSASSMMSLLSPSERIARYR